MVKEVARALEIDEFSAVELIDGRITIKARELIKIAAFISVRVEDLNMDYRVKVRVGSDDLKALARHRGVSVEDILNTLK